MFPCLHACVWSLGGLTHLCVQILAQVEVCSVTGSDRNPGQLDHMCEQPLSMALDGEMDTPLHTLARSGWGSMGRSRAEIPTPTLTPL